MTQVKHSRRRTVVILVALGLVSLAGGMTWRFLSLDGLPDIGDPFDVEAFCQPIPDESNAFVLYREAVGRLGKEPQVSKGSWETASDSEMKWLAENRGALETWRRGTERPDARNISPRDINIGTTLAVAQGLRSFGRLATLEGGRLEAQDDFDGAMGWYLALLRESRHLGRGGSLNERLIGVSAHAIASRRILALAANPLVGAPTIRRALEEATTIDRMTAPDSDFLKIEYLSFLHTVVDPAFDDLSELVSPAPEGSNTQFGKAVFRLTRVLKKEPERSRRIYRLIIANRLEFAGLPQARRPPKVLPNPTIVGKDPALALLGELYRTDLSSPASTRALAPENLARWYASSIYAEILLPSLGAVDNALARERSVQANLLNGLAGEVDRRKSKADLEPDEGKVRP